MSVFAFEASEMLAKTHLETNKDSERKVLIYTDMIIVFSQSDRISVVLNEDSDI